MGHPCPVDLDALTYELYALPREDFTAARDAVAKQARTAGQRDVAAAVKKLAKPNAAAWLANMLAREHAGDVRALLDLGDELRAATAARDGAELRRLAPRQNKLVTDLVAAARRLGEAAGTRVTDDTARGLDETLRAALADSGLGRELAAGRTTDVLRFSGFPDVGFGPAAPRAAPEPDAADDEDAADDRPGTDETAAEADRERAARLARADATVLEAQEAADDAAAAARAARDALDSAGAVKTEATEDVRRLRVELEAALAHRQEAERAEVDARKVNDKAQSTARGAADRLARALAERARIEDRVSR